MKKKIIGIVSVSIIALALLAIGVLLLVKQKNIEETGNVLRVEWYDQDGIEFTITTKEQLYEFARLSDFYDFSKQTIKLGADIVINEGNAKDWAEQAPAERWNPISGFAGRFDGQGHTISGLYGRGLNTPMALFIKTARNCVIQDVKLVNSYFKTSGNSGTASFISNGGGKLTKLYSDAIIDCEGESSAGIASNVTGQSTFEECWYEGVITTTNRECGGLIDGIFGSRVTMKHCLFSGEINNTYGFSETRTGGNRTGGLVGRIDAESTLIINDSLCSGVINEDVNNQTGAFIGLAHGGAELMINDVYISQDSFYRVYGKQGAGATATGSPLWIASENLKGTDAYRFTTLDFTKYWATAEEGPVLRCFADEVPSVEGVEKAYDLSWFDKLSMNNVIMDAKDLYGMYILSGTTDFTDASVKLGADIVYNEGKASDWKKTAPEYNWYPIRSYSGIFDGQGHTISGIYIDWNIEGEHCGLFGVTNKTSQIKNFSLKNSYITCSVPNSQTATGSITGTTQGKIENIYSDAIIYGENSGIGGIVGSANGKVAKVVSNCWFDGEIIGGEKSRYQGGIVAYTSAGTLSIEHCLNSGNITTNVETAGPNAGGFLGMVNGGDGIAIKDSLNVGTVTTNGATNNAGSAIGYIQKERVATIDHVYNILEGHKQAIGFQNGILRGAILTQKIDYMKGTGGYTRTTLDFKNYWSIVKDSTPILKTFAASSPSVAGLKREIDVSWYDADKDTYMLKTPEQFRAFAIMANSIYFKDKTVKLGADIKFNEGNAAEWGTNPPADVWTPIKRFDGTFDGQGHTVSGIYVKREDVGHAGLFGMAFGDIKNLKLTNSYFCHTEAESGDSVVGSIVGVSRGNISNVYSDAIVVSHTKQASGGIVGIMNADTDKVISNAWFAGSLTLGETSRYGGGIVGMTNDGTLKIEHCLNSGAITTNNKKAGSNTGGIIGGIIAKSKEVVIADSLTVGVVEATEGSMTNNMGSVVGLINPGNKLTISNTFASKESHKNGVGFNNKGTLNGIVLQLDEADLLGYSGYQRTTLDFDKYWAVALNPESTPVLKAFAEETPDLTSVVRLIDLDWYDADKDTYILKTPEQFRAFAIMANSIYFKDKTVKLGADIKFNEGNAAEWGTNPPADMWTPIKRFDGTFDGQGHTVSGIYVKREDVGHAGLFGMAFGDIKNLKLTNSYFCHTETESGDSVIGSIVGVSRGNISNVYSDAIVMSHTKQASGGIVGIMNANTDKEISNVWFAGSLTLGETSRYGGGIVGMTNEGTLKIEHCLNSGTMIVNTTVGSNAGGILGGVRGTSGKVSITDTLGVADITAKGATNNLGSVIGFVDKEKVVDIKDTYASIESYAANAIGYKYGNSKVDGYILRLKEAELFGDGGYQFTTLDFDKNWAVVEKGTPVLKLFGGTKPSVSERHVDTDWYETGISPYTIKNYKEMFTFALISEYDDFSNKEIVLKGTITIPNEGKASSWATSAPQFEWYPIKNFAGTLEGNGNIIENVYVHNDEGGFVGLFELVTGAVQNLKLENSYFCTTESTSDNTVIGSIAGAGRGSFTNIYSDAIVNASNKAGAGGLIGAMTGATDKVLRGCWYNGVITLGESSQFDGGLVGYTSDGTLKIEHSLFSGTLTTTNTVGTGSGGLIGSTRSNCKSVEIVDSLSAGTMNEKDANSEDDKDPATNNKGSIIGLINSVTDVTLEDTYAAISTYEKTIGLKYNNNATLSGDGNAYRLSQTDISGYMAYQVTSLDFENAWSVVEGKIPIPQYFGGKTKDLDDYEKLADLKWYFADTADYQIWDAKDLYGMAVLSEGQSFGAKTVRVYDDIHMNSQAEDKDADAWSKGDVPSSVISWRPIRNFTGQFDGNGHTISGLYYNGSGSNIGLFGMVGKCEIADICLVNSFFKTTSFPVGSVVGKVNAKASFSKLYSDAIVAGAHNSGGIIGSLEQNADTTSISECWFKGSITTSGNSAGGILGKNNQALEVKITNCLNNGTITANGSAGRVAGICGDMNNNSGVTIDMSLNTGTVTGNSKGSLVGYVSGTNCALTIKNSYNVEVSNLNTIGTQQNGSSITIESSYRALNVAKLSGWLATANTNLQFDDPNKNGENDGLWIARASKTPVLRYFDSDGLYAQEGGIVVATENIDGVDTTVYIIDTMDELYAISKMVAKGHTFKNEIVRLGASIADNTLKNGQSVKDWVENPPAKVWEPIGSYISNTETVPFMGTFDGQGFTISGLYSKDTNYVGLFGCTQDSIIKHFNLEESCFIATGNWVGSIASWGSGVFEKIYSTAYVQGGGVAGGLVGRVDINPGTTGISRISECWFAGSMSAKEVCSGGFVGRAQSANLIIEHGLVTGTVQSTKGRLGAFCGDVAKANNVVGKLLIKDSLMIPTKDSTVSDVSKAVGFIEDGSSSKVKTTYVVSLEEVKGTLGYDNTELQFDRPETTDVIEGSWVARVNDAPALKWKVAQGGMGTIADITGKYKANIGWHSEADTFDGTKVYEIATMEEFLGLAELSESKVNFVNERIVLTADITVNFDAPTTSKDATATKNAWTDYLKSYTPINWKPIGVKKAFAGEFDGQGYSIRGIYSSSSVQNTGLFGFADIQSSIHDFALVDSYFESNTDNVGGIVGFARGDISYVYCNAYVKGPNAVGGIVGVVDFNRTASNTEECVISNCWYDGTVSATGIHVGGVIGAVNRAYTNASIEHCLNTGYITSSNTKHGRVGGLCGNINVPNVVLNIEDSLNVGNVVCSINAGAVVGRNAGTLKAGTNSTYFVTGVSGSASKAIGTGSATSGAIVGASPEQLKSDNANNIGLNKSNWTFYTDKTPELTNLIKYLSK